jgi:hypothetical protein
MLRRAVEIARQQHLADLVAQGKQGVAAAAAAAAGAGSSHRHGQQQQPQGCEVEWQEGDQPLVERSHTRQAQSEMFSALHHQLLRSRSCWEKLLLVAVVVEARATGRSAVVIQVGRSGVRVLLQRFYGHLLAARYIVHCFWMCFAGSVAGR